MQEYVKEIAECGADLIMFDDDFRFGHQTGDIACTCEHHMKRIGEILGEDITPEKLREKALTGGGNRYRDAWMRANGESLIAFAKAMREAVDSVNPAVRMGQCSCMSSWGVDGALPGGGRACVCRGHKAVFPPHRRAVLGGGQAL